MPLLDSLWMGKGFNLGREQRENPLPLCSKAISSSFAGLGAWQDPRFPGRHRVEVCIKKVHLLELVIESGAIPRKKNVGS